jgi:dTDP-glucose 4,6-dehydratase
MRQLLVTGGCGFLGGNLIRHLLRRPDVTVVNLDKLTYAGNLASLADLHGHPRYSFVRCDVCDRDMVRRVMGGGVTDVFHLAAESHVDRSIQDSGPFVKTNVLGTQVLLDAAREAGVQRFVHVSADEVYGSLGPAGAFTECSPLFVKNLLAGQPVPVYGDGRQVRDWIHVHDHCAALERVWEAGRQGEVYNIGARAEKANIEITGLLLDILDKPRTLIRYVTDRPGHDRRYAIDPGKVERELGWRPAVPFEQGLRDTVAWYRANQRWVADVCSGEYARYYERQYGPPLAA